MSKPLKKKMKLTGSSGQGSEGRMPGLRTPAGVPDRPLPGSSSGGAAAFTDRPFKAAKKTCGSFQEEWLSQFVQTVDKQAVKLGDIFSFSSEKGLICKTCRDANIPGDFSEGKVQREWTVNLLKRHVKQKSHVNAVGILGRRTQGFGTAALQPESAEEQRRSDEPPHEDKSETQKVKVLIDNVLNCIKMDASLLNVQQTHDHMAKYVSLPENWRSEEDTNDFVYSISKVVQHETMCNIRKAPWHTLIVGLHDTMLVMYIKYREENEVTYKTEFCGIIELSIMHGVHGYGIHDAITEFYREQRLDLQRMVMLTSNDASEVLGEHEGAAALILGYQIPHLTEQHCVIHRKDKLLDTAWDLPLMREVSALLKALAVLTKSGISTWCSSRLRNLNLEEVLRRVSSRPSSDREPQWLACYRAMLAVQRNGLETYCGVVCKGNGDPVAKYCAEQLSEYKIAFQAVLKVLHDVVVLDDSLKKGDLTVMQAHRMARAKVATMRSQYCMDRDECGDDEGTIASTDEDIVLFIRTVCDLLDTFSAEGLSSEWSAFDIAELSRANFASEFGDTDVAVLAKKYEAILRPQSMDAIKREYADFKRIVKLKLKRGRIDSFSDVLAATLGHTELREISQLVDICGTFQASTAECDRGFDLMNEITKASGPSMHELHLDQLIRIKSRQEAHGAIDLDMVYDHWRCERDRREREKNKIRGADEDSDEDSDEDF